MAKQRQQSKQQIPVTAANASAPVKPFWQPPAWSAYLIVFLFACMLYSNTLWNTFALDDAVVLTSNRFTKQGVAGLKDQFTNDMFVGYAGESAHVVSGGRYRPAMMASLTLEYELMRRLRHDPRKVITDKNIIMGERDPYLAPMLSHAINVLFFALTALVLYYLLLQLIPIKKNQSFLLSVPFLVTMLFAAHPIHTEAVANIKGRDEVMCMLFSLLALLATVKYVQTGKIFHLLWGVLAYFTALISKENAITFLAVIPITYFFFTNAKEKDYVITLGIYLLPVAAFLVLRSKVAPVGLYTESTVILNNPFALASLSQRHATTFLTFLYYFKLLIFPHPLTQDYYFNQIPYIDYDDVWFVVSFVVNAALLIYALLGLRKKTLPSYAILFYFITFSIVSNLFFTVGVLMNERFIYMSSLGFCILLVWLLLGLKERYRLSNYVAAATFVIILSLYSAGTFARNFDWKNNLTLFSSDIWSSPNSVRSHCGLAEHLMIAADGDIKFLRSSNAIKSTFCNLSNGTLSEAQLDRIQNYPDDSIRHLLLDSAIAQLNDGLQIYPDLYDARIALGNALFKRDNRYDEVISVYEKAGRVYPAFFNLGKAYNETNNPLKAKENLLNAYTIKPGEPECSFLLAQVCAKLNQPDSVTFWLQKGSQFRAPNENDYYNIGHNFGTSGRNTDKAIEYLQKAIDLNPKAEMYYANLAACYGLAGKFDEAIAVIQKLIALNPQYADAYKYLSITYRGKGNTEMADQYMKKYNELKDK